MPLDPRDFPVHEHTLANGLRVRLLADSSLPLWFFVPLFRCSHAGEAATPPLPRAPARDPTWEQVDLGFDDAA